VTTQYTCSIANCSGARTHGPGARRPRPPTSPDLHAASSSHLRASQAAAQVVNSTIYARRRYCGVGPFHLPEQQGGRCSPHGLRRPTRSPLPTSSVPRARILRRAAPPTGYGPATNALPGRGHESGKRCIEQAQAACAGQLLERRTLRPRTERPRAHAPTHRPRRGLRAAAYPPPPSPALSSGRLRRQTHRIFSRKQTRVNSRKR
jgi:hypothetical protein